MALANTRLVIDSLEQIQQHTHEIANLSIDRAEAADTRLTLKGKAPDLREETGKSETLNILDFYVTRLW